MPWLFDLGVLGSMISIVRRAKKASSHAAQLRRLWVAAASSDPSLDTALAQCFNTVRSSVGSDHWPPKGDSQSCCSCFALVSQTYPSPEIERLGVNIKQLLGNNVHVSGTVVDSVFHGSNRAPGNGISILFHHPEARRPDGPAPQATLAARPFYIGDSHGRQRLREVAVGRWHNKVTDRFEEHKDSTFWTPGISSVTRAASHLELPAELTSIDDPESVQLILFVSDKETRQVLDALDERFPDAVKLGIVGSQTPFLNGHDYTLISDTGLHESGVTGLAFVSQGGDRSQGSAVGTPFLSSTGLEAVGEAMRIERCQGNVILDLEDGSGVHSLIAELRKRGQMEAPEADDRLFARITPGRDFASEDGVLLQVTGGNPAKGGLALDTLRDLAPGQYIQFLMGARRPEAAPANIAANAIAPSKHALQIWFGAGTNCDAHRLQRQVNQGGSAPTVFGGVTEGGFSYGKPSCSSTDANDGSVFSGSAECAVPGSTAILLLK
ncbi:hypothetical protein GGF46_004584 [Coemansia sp. RSA 552]|nr:hypothetical protein GGF46_004584 [Coemansia sp. RSA 552]